MSVSTLRAGSRQPVSACTYRMEKTGTKESILQRIPSRDLPKNGGENRRRTGTESHSAVNGSTAWRRPIHSMVSVRPQHGADPFTGSPSQKVFLPPSGGDGRQNRQDSTTICHTTAPHTFLSASAQGKGTDFAAFPSKPPPSGVRLGHRSGLSIP